MIVAVLCWLNHWMGLPVAWTWRRPDAIIRGQIGLPHAMTRVRRKPIAQPISRCQNPVRDGAGGDALKKFVKGLPAFPVWFRLIWIGSGGMVLC